jgi:soluble lytic murein transglycosylase-like protein
MLAAFAMAGPALADTVYESVGQDGQRRYADRPLDASYRRISAATGARPANHVDSGVQPRLVRAVVHVESRGNPSAVSSKGARGLMQLMPATASEHGLSQNETHDPGKNLAAGTAHLRKLLRLHGGNEALALAAYNAGAGAVARHGQRIPPYRETMLYVPAVLARAATQP